MASAADHTGGRSEGDQREIAELCALADDTLDFERQRKLEVRIAASPELRTQYQQQRCAVDLLRTAQSVSAPASLRARIQVPRESRRRFSARPAFTLTAAAALAVLVLALEFVSPIGTPSAPSLSQAAVLATKGSAASAPAPDPDNPSVKLRLRVEKLYFPNWSGRFGWRAAGQRIDHIDGRLTVTVYYASHGRRIAYTIVAAPALAQPRAPVRRVRALTCAR